MAFRQGLHCISGKRCVESAIKAGRFSSERTLHCISGKRCVERQENANEQTQNHCCIASPTGGALKAIKAKHCKTYLCCIASLAEKRRKRNYLIWDFCISCIASLTGEALKANNGHRMAFLKMLHCISGKRCVESYFQCPIWITRLAALLL
jgi:hypothetical protein